MYIHVITYSWFLYKGPDQAYTVVRISLPIQSQLDLIIFIKSSCRNPWTSAEPWDPVQIRITQSQLDLIIFIKSSCRNPWNCETLGPGVNPDQLEL